MSDTEKGIHSGHRMRMRKKFADYGRDIFNTYELLEMLLYHSIPLKNTNPIARRLIAEFSDIEGVFTASKEELMSVEGVGERTADMIKAVGKIRIDREGFNLKKVPAYNFKDYNETGSFFVSYFDGRRDYETVMLLLDNKMSYIDFVSMADADYEMGAIKPKNFIDTAIRARASVCVIAHNHPYGPLYPTSGDVETNNMIRSALSGAGVILVEHYVVSGDGYLGFMNHLETAFYQKANLERFRKSEDISE